MSKPKSIDEYLNMAPLDQRSELTEIRRLIEKNLPKATGIIGPSGFPVYNIGNQWKAGFAYKPQGPMIYIMEPELLNRYEAKLKMIRAGKTSLRYSSARNLPMGELRRLLSETLQTINDAA